MKKASARQMILNRDVSGVITSIPCKSVACCGRIITAPIASANPRVAAKEQMPEARVLARPMPRTASAVTAIIASGEASLSRSR